MVDAAGAIYVIGGTGTGFFGTTNYNDVWVSTDGGARPDSVHGGGRWVPAGVLRGTMGNKGVV